MITDYLISEDQLYVYSPFCWGVVRDSKKLGGKFDKDKRAWVFPKSRTNEVLENYLGLPGPKVKVRVKLTDLKDEEREDNYLKLGWYVLAVRDSRDKDPRVYADIVKGEIDSSGGSVKNPRVNLSEDGEFELWVLKDFAERRGLEIIEEDDSERGGMDNGDKKSLVIKDIKKMMEDHNITLEDLKNGSNK